MTQALSDKKGAIIRKVIDHFVYEDYFEFTHRPVKASLR